MLNAITSVATWIAVYMLAIFVLTSLKLIFLPECNARAGLYRGDYSTKCRRRKNHEGVHRDSFKGEWSA